MTSRSRSSSTKSAASLATSDGVLDREAGVGRVHGRRVVDAVAEEADDVAHLLQRQDDALLLVRIHLHEQVGPLGLAPQRLVVQLVELACP